MENNFNLIDEKWMPSNIGLVGIRDCFNNFDIKTVGSNCSQRMSIIALLSAIAHASHVYEDCRFEDSNFVNDVNKYLDKQYDKFFLYGENPFLQYLKLETLPQADKAYNNCKEFLKGIAYGNNAFYSEQHKKQIITDSDKALLLLDCVCGYSTGAKINTGQKANLKITEDEEYKKFYLETKKENNGIIANLRPGNHFVYMNGYVFLDNIVKTIYYNMYIEDDILEQYCNGVGKPPWELNLTETNYEYSDTYMSELIPMNVFMLLKKNDERFYRTEGIMQCYTDHYIKKQFSKFEYINKDNELECAKCTYSYGFDILIDFIKFNRGNWNKQINHTLEQCSANDENNIKININGYIYKNTSSQITIQNVLDEFLKAKATSLKDSDCVLKYFKSLSDLNQIKSNLINCIEFLNKTFGSFPIDEYKKVLSVKLINLKIHIQRELFLYCENNNDGKIKEIYDAYIKKLQRFYVTNCNNPSYYLYQDDNGNSFLQYLWKKCYPFDNKLLKKTYFEKV